MRHLPFEPDEDNNRYPPRTAFPIWLIPARALHDANSRPLLGPAPDLKVLPVYEGQVYFTGSSLGENGVPDVIAIKAGRTYALELKAPGGQITATQRAAHAALRAAGAAVAVADGLDAAIERLERWELLRGSSRGFQP
jgi:hypothetical protein